MPADTLEFSRNSFLFLVALTRAAAILIPLGAPGLQRFATAPKILLALLLAMVLWPQMRAAPMETLWDSWRQAPLATSTALVMGELSLGVCCGLLVALMIESLTWAMHLVGLNAGYQFASTFDPHSEADSAVLTVLGQLLGGLIFFTSGLYRHFVSIFVLSLEPHPPGWLLSADWTRTMGGALTQLTILAMKLALPIVGLLILLDLAMALMNRIHSHLNLISITFPAKMLLTLAVAAHLLGGWSVLVQKEGASWAKQVAAAVLAEEQGGR